MATISQIAAPPGMARSNLRLRKTSFRWTHQQPSKAATDSQIAAPPLPPGMARSNLNPGVAPLRWTHQQPSNMATVSQIAAPQGWRGLI